MPKPRSVQKRPQGELNTQRAIEISKMILMFWHMRGHMNHVPAGPASVNVSWRSCGLEYMRNSFLT